MMKEEPRTKVTHLRNRNFKHKMKRQQISQKLLYEKFWVHEQILPARNCRVNLSKNLLHVRKHVNQTTAI